MKILSKLFVGFDLRWKWRWHTRCEQTSMQYYVQVVETWQWRFFWVFLWTSHRRVLEVPVTTMDSCYRGIPTLREIQIEEIWRPHARPGERKRCKCGASTCLCEVLDILEPLRKSGTRYTEDSGTP